MGIQSIERQFGSGHCSHWIIATHPHVYLTSHTRHILGKLKSTSVLAFGVLAVEVVFGGSHKRVYFKFYG